MRRTNPLSVQGVRDVLKRHALIEHLSDPCPPSEVLAIAEDVSEADVSGGQFPAIYPELWVMVGVEGPVLHRYRSGVEVTPTLGAVTSWHLADNLMELAAPCHPDDLASRDVQLLKTL